MKKLSVITINLNNKNGLEKTIDSIINQTFTNFELIVIDGGSTDGSLDIINKNANNITCKISEPDTGIYHAMNKGILNAGGDYCFFLNSGDYFVNADVLSAIFSKNLTEDVVQGNMLVSLNNKIVGKCSGKEILTFLDVYSSIIKHQASFIKRNLFTKFGPYNESLKIVADWEFFIKSVGLGNASYRYVNIDISIFDNNGISNNNSAINTKEKKEVLDKLIPKLMRPDYEKLSVISDVDIVSRYGIPAFILRILTKITKIYSKITLTREHTK